MVAVRDTNKDTPRKLSAPRHARRRREDLDAARRALCVERVPSISPLTRENYRVTVWTFIASPQKEMADTTIKKDFSLFSFFLPVAFGTSLCAPWPLPLASGLPQVNYKFRNQYHLRHACFKFSITSRSRNHSHFNIRKLDPTRNRPLWPLLRRRPAF